MLLRTLSVILAIGAVDYFMLDGAAVNVILKLLRHFGMP
jgi:hypothetical protein